VKCDLQVILLFEDLEFPERIGYLKLFEDTFLGDAIDVAVHAVSDLILIAFGNCGCRVRIEALIRYC
jgi:hypothetical protein